MPRKRLLWYWRPATILPTGLGLRTWPHGGDVQARRRFTNLFWHSASDHRPAATAMTASLVVHATVIALFLVRARPSAPPLRTGSPPVTLIAPRFDAPTSIVRKAR